MAAHQPKLNNLLNRQITTGWRRSQISLNGPPSSASAASLTSSRDDVQSSIATAGQISNVSSNAPSPSATTDDAADDVSVKRKAGVANIDVSTLSSSGVLSALDPRTVYPVASTSSIEAQVPQSPALKKARKRAANGDVYNSDKAGLDGVKSTKARKHDPPTTRLADLGGVSQCVEQILELVAMPICHPEIYLHTGVRPPRGVLLHGPPGCGKTMLANAIAGEVGAAFISISAPSIVSGMSGESEKTLRETFEEAAKAAPCILFIDEIDAITPKRESAQREMERRIVAQLLTCMDDLSWDKTDNKPVIIIGATNRPDSLDPALRRAGRFDHEIAMGVPDEDAREQILRVQSAHLKLSGDFDFKALAKATPGYVGADLSALTGTAGVIAVKRIFGNLHEIVGTKAETLMSAPGDMNIDEKQHVTAPSIGPSSATEMSEHNATSLATRVIPLDTSPIASFLQAHPQPLTAEQLEPISISYADFQAALEQVQPSSKREGFTTIPDVTWASVGALNAIRDELRMAIVSPIKHRELFEAVGIANPCGVLLWGPPGCGKTLLAKAVANESKANFISVKGPELLNKYVGESERAVRQVFARARASSPCIIFFDELDALIPKRDGNLSESSSRVVNTLLTELDGLTPRKQVFVVGATNRPDMIDPAMVRPGRLDKLLYVDLPTSTERSEILAALTRKTPLADDVNLQFVAQSSSCDGFSGADMGALVREASVAALRELLARADGQDMQHTGNTTNVRVAQHHFEMAMQRVAPSVSAAQRKRHEALRSKFSGTPVGQKTADAVGSL